jgi:hypothetical protein
MEQALRACTLWLWLDLRFPGVYGHVDEVVALRSQLNDGIERQLKGKRPLAQPSGPRGVIHSTPALVPAWARPPKRAPETARAAMKNFFVVIRGLLRLRPWSGAPLHNGGARSPVHRFCVKGW